MKIRITVTGTKDADHISPNEKVYIAGLGSQRNVELRIYFVFYIQRKTIENVKRSVKDQSYTFL